jgi:peroxiredoxin Q/BCP
MLNIGDKAPNFTLKDKDGKEISLSDFLGKKVVVYFYPKDNTPGCTRQGCAFAQSYEAFKEKNAEVIGISKDSVASHVKFAEKYNLPFVLLSDRDEENLMAGFYAAQRGVKKVIVKSGRDNYSSIMHNMGLDSIISTLNVACNSILRTVRARASRSFAAVERMYRLMDDQAEALEFIAGVGDPYIHVPLKELNVIKDALIGVIVREGQVRIPFGNDTIEPGDHVVVISRKLGLSALGEIFRKG